MLSKLKKCTRNPKSKIDHFHLVFLCFCQLSPPQLSSAQFISLQPSLSQLSSAQLSPARFFKFFTPLKMDSFTNDSNCAQAKFVLLAAPTPFSSQLSPAQLSSAQLSSAQLSPAQLSSAQLSSVQLSSVQLSSAQLSSARLTSARLGSI